jgi:DNA-binding beta-propeller fold protein YncE/cytochrome c peroxidase
MILARFWFVIALAALSLATAPALALGLDVTHSGPSVVGEAHVFTAVISDASGEVTLAWKFGESEAPQAGPAEISHTFTAPGHYSVTVEATDAGGNSSSWSFQHLVHHPVTANRPTSSTSIVYDRARNRVYSVNQDNDSVTSVDADGLTKLAELPVYRRPESLALTPEGKLWVVHQDDYAVAVVDPERFEIERGFRLPYASQPVGLAVSPTGDAAYVSLMALGRVLKLDPSTGAILGGCEVGPSPRGLSVSHDGRDVYVTRFISPDTGGEVVKLDAAAMQVASRIALPVDSATMDGPQGARGLPNYLFSVALTPDGRQAWVPGKKDNIFRGQFRDGQKLTHDTTVRPLVAVIDTQAAQEISGNRIDLDDRSLPVQVEFTPLGNLAIVALAGSNRLELRDVNRPTQVFSAIGDAGVFPRASVLAPNKRLFVQGALSREILVYNLSAALDYYDKASPTLLETIPAVASEKLPPEVLAGKKIFHNSEDLRMTAEGYMSCGVCHFEGVDDGRVWDFGDRGEGLRNTMALLGRSGTLHGRLNWSGNLDEVQDFEHQIRTLFLGRGFLAEEVFATGTRNQPLGEPKARLSAELDALAAYVASLADVNRSPYRNADGSLTPAAVAGKVAYEKLGCDFCHGGAEFTDSSQDLLHDVGTITTASGTRAGQPLFSIDTPTLLGVWETAPYLHDGSAPTLRDVLTTKNPDGLHGYASALSSQELDELVAYLMQIDDGLPIRRLPFDPPEPVGGASGGGAGGSEGGALAGGNGAASPGSGGSSGGGSSGGAPAGNGGVPSGEQPPPAASGADSAASCAFTVPSGTGEGDRRAAAVIALSCLYVVASARRRHRKSALGRVASGVLFATLLSGCSGNNPDDTPPTGLPSATGGSAGIGGSGGGGAGPGDWSLLPPQLDADRELEPLGVRTQTYERICGRARGDAFSRALCGAGRRPEIRGMTELLALVGLTERRAFALTANSTSLVAMSVSAINPRILVFPRVESSEPPLPTMTSVGFVRGEQFVEIVSRDVAAGDLNFYLFAFEQPCNYRPGGCDLASLLTEEIERDWTAYSVYDQDDLEHTSFDCLSCHQPGGHATKRILRMQELSGPWMHWFPQRFAQRTESDRVLGAQFAEAHQGEAQYGGIPIASITNAIDEGSGAQLEALVRSEGFAQQPNPFDALIAAEMKSGTSATWQARFDSHLRGEAIAVPYPGIDVTDQTARAAAVGSYRSVVAGLAPRESLTDIRAIFSPEAEQKLSFVSQPGADGKTVLAQMCARCHDGRGNPALRKNQFNVLRLGEMSRSQKDLAIERIHSSDAIMPPRRAGRLTPEAIQAATLELQK